VTKIDDLNDVEVEHFLGEPSGQPLVKLRVKGPGVILIGQMDPASARQIANDLLICAARSEYERDLVVGSKMLGVSKQNAVASLLAVRKGEEIRMLKEQDK
jgi:hypothetical protein